MTMKITFPSSILRWSARSQLIVLAFLLVSTTKAQIPDGTSDYWKWVETPGTTDPYAFKGQVLTQDGEEVHAIIQFLNSVFPELIDSRSTLELATFKESPIGTHYQFHQKFRNRRVFGSEVKVNLRKGRIISTTIASLVDTRSWSDNVLVSNPELSEGMEEVIFFDGLLAQTAWTFEDQDPANNKFDRVIKLADGNVLRKDEALHNEGAEGDTTAMVYVYNPDPLTSYEMVYGGGIKNFGDKDTDSLTKARELHILEVKYENDTFWLENDHARVFGGLNFKVPFSLTDTFDYTRSQNAFEYVNSIFHVTQYKKYLASVGGFDDLLDYQLRINARAFLDDNSSFKRSSNSGGKGVLYFGYSSASLEHVDDAEDADVIIHELGHALSYSANENIPVE